MEEHWSTRVRERALWRDSAGRLPVELSGGSDTGRFTWIRPLASHTYEDVLLEVEDLPVSGRPLCDVLHLLTHCGDPIRIRTVKAGAVGGTNLIFLHGAPFSWLLICPQHYTLFYVILSNLLCYIILQAIIKVKVQMLTSDAFSFTIPLMCCLDIF